MTDREGPSLTLKASCFGCKFEVSESYSVQSDSGSDVFCAHPSHESRRRIGDTIWTTPDWCPLADIPAVREHLATPAQPVDETERLQPVTLDRFIFEWFNERDPKAMQTCLEEYDARSAALQHKGEVSRG